MIPHQSNQLLSLSLSLSEVRVRQNYSLISCSLFIKHSPSHDFKLLSATDSVENPGIGGFVTFHDDISVEWLLDWEQYIRVELRTLETPYDGARADTLVPLLVACAEFPLADTLVAGKEYRVPLEGVAGIQCCILHINMRELETNRLTLVFKCSTRISHDSRGKRDLFAKLLHKEEARESKSTSRLHIDLATKYQTGVMQHFVCSESKEFAETIEWDTMYVPVSSIREFHLDSTVWIRLWERERDQGHNPQKLAQTSETLRSMLTMREQDYKRLDLKPIPGLKTGLSLASSALSISECRLVKFPTAVDYLLGGYEISLTLAIDFTVSNGDHTLPSSYHYLSPSKENSYMECIRSAINFTQKFSKNSLDSLPVIAYGFGAVSEHSRQASHCFALNQKERDPTIHSQHSVLSYYADAVKTMDASGPASLRHVIHKCLRDVMAQESYSPYRVCYVLAACAISDLSEVQELLVESAKYPVSFVFVGIGDQKGLGKMEEMFKAEARVVSAGGTRAVRCNVLYRDWKSLRSQTQEKGQKVRSAVSLSLTSILLNQFRGYYRLINIAPPGPIDTRDPAGTPYRSLTKQTSLYGHYLTADLSEIKMFQEAQLQATSTPDVPLKRESSITQTQATPLSTSLIKPITLDPDSSCAPLRGQESLLRYSSYLTPLSADRGQMGPVLHPPNTPLIHEDSLKIPKFNIDD